MLYKSIFLSLISSLLLILSFPKFDLGLLAWVALVPWLLALQGQKPGRAFLISFLVGLMFFSGSLYWVNHVSSLGFSALVIYLALYFALFGLIFAYLKRGTIFFLPCAWVTLEYIRAHLFTGFSWSLLGYSQYKFLPIIQISDLSGAYGVSFLIVLVNVGIWHFLLRTRRVLLRILCCLILALSYGYFRLAQQPEGSKIKVCVVQGNIAQHQKWDPRYRDFILEQYFGLTEAAAKANPQLIIWPETSVPGYLENEDALLAQLRTLSRQIGPSYLLVGTPHVGEGQALFNSATLLHQGEILQRYDKLHLVPFGEFMPWPKLFSRFSFASLIGSFTAGKDYTVFTIQSVPTEIKLSALICFEDVFAYLARGFVRSGAQILVNMTNDAWFQDSAGPYQHLQASVFRAVENRVNVVRSANTGVSCFINPYGQIISRVADESGRDLLIAAEKTQELEIISLPSFYTAHGDLFAWLCIIMTALGLIIRRPPLL